MMKVGITDSATTAAKKPSTVASRLALTVSHVTTEWYRHVRVATILSKRMSVSTPSKLTPTASHTVAAKAFSFARLANTSACRRN